MSFRAACGARPHVKLLDIEHINASALTQFYLPLKEGGCGFFQHSGAEICKFFVASALLIAPFVFDATGLQIGVCEPEIGDMQRYDSEVCLANAGNLLVAAGTTQPNFARTGPVESKMFLHQVSQTLQAAKRTALEESFVAAGDINSRARVRSAGGVGAQWLACLPTSPALCFEDDDFRLMLRFRLGLDTFTSGICPHVNQEGVACGEYCDPAGWHLFSCAAGGGWYMAHDTVVLAYCNLVAGCDGIPGATAAWKPDVAAWREHPEPDALFDNLPGTRATYIDGVISLANPATYPGCERKAGHLAELKKRDKHRQRPVFDAHHRRCLPFDFKALSFERHGFWSREAVVLTQRLAARKASMLGLEPSSEIQHWYAVIACAIQRTNAKILRGEPVPACAYPLPRAGFATGRRDLPLAGR